MPKNQVDQKLLSSIAIGVLSLTVITALWFLLAANDASETTSHILIALVFFSINALTAAASFSILHKPQYRILSITSMAVSVMSFLLLAIIFVSNLENTQILRFAFSIFILSIGLAHVCRLFKIRIVNRFAFISRIIAIVGVAACSATIIAFIFLSEEFDRNYIIPLSDTNDSSQTFILNVFFASEYLKLALFAMFILNLGFTALTPLLNKLDYGRKIEILDELDEDFLKDVEY